MKNIAKILTVSSILALSGCADLGQQSTFGERLSDNFLFTSAQTVSDSETRCVTLTKPFQFVSGTISYSLPSGTYKGTRKNSSGYYYYAPGEITSTSWQTGSFSGIYINNQFNQGNLIKANPMGYDNRPVRITVLPSNIFQYLKETRHC